VTQEAPPPTPARVRRLGRRRVITEAAGQMADESAVAGDAPPPEGPIDQTSDDTPSGWGEREPVSRRDQWLLEQRPPHWD